MNTSLSISPRPREDWTPWLVAIGFGFIAMIFMVSHILLLDRTARIERELASELRDVYWQQCQKGVTTRSERDACLVAARERVGAIIAQAKAE